MSGCTAVRQQIELEEPAPKVVLLDGESINDIDATAVITLQEFNDQLQQTDIRLRSARFESDVLAVMESGSLEESVPPEQFSPTVQAAVDAYLSEQVRK